METPYIHLISREYFVFFPFVKGSNMRCSTARGLPSQGFSHLFQYEVKMITQSRRRSSAKMTRRDWGTTNKPESDVEGKFKMNQNPYHPLDWYFYLHSFDFCGKNRYKYSRHGSYGTEKYVYESQVGGSVSANIDF